MKRYTFLFFAILILVLAFIDKGQISGDGAVRWKALVQLMEDHQLNADKFSIVQPVLAAPLYWIADLWVKSRPDDLDDPRRIQLIRKVVQRFNKFVVLGIAILFYRILRNTFELNQMKALLGTLFLLFGSILIPNASDFYSECLGCLLLFFALISLTQLCVSSSLKFLDAGLLILCMPLLIALNPITSIPLGFLLILLFLLRYTKHSGLTGRVNLAVLTGGISWILGVALVFGENYVRRGNILHFGYATDEFRGNFANGFVGLLASPTRGLLFFIPTFFLGIPLISRTRSSGFTSPRTLFLWSSLIYSLVLVLAYSKYYYWHGGWYWGPRYMLPLSVFGALYFTLYRFQFWPELNKWHKRIWILTGALAISVYKIGVTINQRHMLKCLQTYPLEERCYWDFAYLPFVSYLDARDIETLILHRSTAVELVCGVLFLLLFFRMKNSMKRIDVRN